MARRQILLLKRHIPLDFDPEAGEMLNEPVELTFINLDCVALSELISNCRWQADHRATLPGGGKRERNGDLLLISCSEDMVLAGIEARFAVLTS